MDGDDRVAGRSVARAGPPLPAQADRLAVLDAGGNGDVERLAGRQGDARRAAARDDRQRHVHRNGDVLAAVRRAAAPAHAAAEQLGENVGLEAGAAAGSPPKSKLKPRNLRPRPRPAGGRNRSPRTAARAACRRRRSRRGHRRRASSRRRESRRPNRSRRIVPSPSTPCSGRDETSWPASGKPTSPRRRWPTSPAPALHRGRA